MSSIRLVPCPYFTKLAVSLDKMILLDKRAATYYPNHNTNPNPNPNLQYVF